MRLKHSFFAAILTAVLILVFPANVFSAAKSTSTTPKAPTLSYSPSTPTNGNVTVTVNYPNNALVKQYKLGTDGTWTRYSAPFTITSNTYVGAQYQDKYGKWSAVGGVTISNIDKTPPASPAFTASTTLNTSLPVTITINYSSDSVEKQYRIGMDGSWTNYTMPVTLGTNNTIYAKASDAAGNWSTESGYAVTNIVPSAVPSKMVLGYTVKYSSTDMTSYNSMTANAGSINEIATATFNVDGYGNLTGTAPVDQINYANGSGINPNLMVSNNFDTNIARQLLESPSNRQNLTASILNLLQTYNYKGVHIDIENIPAADRDYFTTFMSEVYNKLKPLGYGVSVAVQAKTYDSPNAAWNYAFDYKSLAQYADYLMIMAYDEHYPGGTPGAVASIGFVTNVLDYALTVVPKEKLVLGLAAYGYDWSSGATKSYSVNGCINLAGQYGSTIYLDGTTKSKYFTYTANGISHTVWFEDGDTIACKLDLVNSRDIRGIGIWRLGLENTNYWNTIKSKLNK